MIRRGLFSALAVSVGLWVWSSRRLGVDWPDRHPLAGRSRRGTVWP